MPITKTLMKLRRALLITTGKNNVMLLHRMKLKMVFLVLRAVNVKAHVAKTILFSKFQRA